MENVEEGEWRRSREGGERGWEEEDYEKEEEEEEGKGREREKKRERDRRGEKKGETEG